MVHLQPLNALGSHEQERELEEVLERLKTQVRTRRLMLYPYFRDFDRVRVCRVTAIKLPSLVQAHHMNMHVHVLYEELVQVHVRMFHNNYYRRYLYM